MKRVLRKGMPIEVVDELKRLVKITNLKGALADSLITIHNEYINKPVQRSDCKKCVEKARTNIVEFLSKTRQWGKEDSK